MNKLVWTTVSDYRLAPSTCGVYQYWQEDKLLYVGKAINIKGGRCEKCQGAGVIKIEMLNQNFSPFFSNPN